MFVGADPPNGFSRGAGDCLSAKPKTPTSISNLETPDEKGGVLEVGRRLLPEVPAANAFLPPRPSKMGAQELTLSYLCDNLKMGGPEVEVSGTNLLGSLEKGKDKGKEAISDSPDDDRKWVERDFLQLNENKGSKREIPCGKDENGDIQCEKKAKIEALNLSLGLPDVSLSLASPVPFPNPDPPKKSRSVQSWAPSTNNTRTSSDDFTAPLSYSCSHQFSHNLSCSLTRNSTENYEYSIGSHRRDNDHIWYCGEGTNGSVHSRFKPVGDSGNFSNNPIRDNQLYRTTSSENHSFFPSELPARPGKGIISSDSRGKAVADPDAKSERLLREIVSESVPIMAQILHEVTADALNAVKDYLKGLLGSEKSEVFTSLQRKLDRRSDLTPETLSKSHEAQLDILVTVKTGIVDYISRKTRLPTTELIEIFCLSRCRNINCKSLLPVEDCDCKFCSTKKGFCSSCMCLVCMKFDCASNTCTWVGCDLCSHWCHAVCGIQLNLIKPGKSSKGLGTTEMQFYCLVCDHASELFGFVSEVFQQCSKDWGLETLKKELDCVRKIFLGSTDPKGKELHNKAVEMLGKLEKRLVSSEDACSCILQSFKSGASDISASAYCSKESPQLAGPGPGPGPMTKPVVPPPSSIILKPESKIKSATDQIITQQNIDRGKKDHLPIEKNLGCNLKYGIATKDEFDSLETIVRIKEAEARMFQSKADDARREAESYRQLVRVKNEKLEEEYSKKLAKLCSQQMEDERRVKLEELKMLENSHCDYYKMKLRMEAEIAGLLERMEATKQQLV